MNATESVLKAALMLEAAGQKPFTAESLVVEVWKLFPSEFGLKGYSALHPDSNKALALLMGKKGLVSRQYLDKVGPKLYQLTRQGWATVSDLEREAVPADLKRGQVPAEWDGLAARLFADPLFSYYREKREDEINFALACRFWGVSADQTTTEQINARLDAITSALNELERMAAKVSPVLSNGRVVTAVDALKLGEFHEYLKTRFDRHLRLLASRKAG